MLISNTVPNSIKSYSTYCGVECRLQWPYSVPLPHLCTVPLDSAEQKSEGGWQALKEVHAERGREGGREERRYRRAYI